MKIGLFFVLTWVTLVSPFNLLNTTVEMENLLRFNFSTNNSSYQFNKSEVERQLLQLSKDSDLIQYYLWTKDNPTQKQRIVPGNFSSLNQSNFNKSNPTRIIIHGILSSYKSEFCTLTRSVYLAEGPHNIICLDWSKIANTSVPTARVALPSIGYDLGAFIQFLNQAGGMSNTNLTVISFSYGTHIAGFAGKYSNKINNPLPLIVACDPASVFFTYDDCSSRICHTDADFVLSIQTTVGTVAFSRPIGDGTYYPNGGADQPGCPPDKENFICGHKRSFQYFAEAIARNDFLTMRCQSYQNALQKKCEISLSDVRMGSVESFGEKGIFYVPVNSRSPFGKGA